MKSQGRMIIHNGCVWPRPRMLGGGVIMVMEVPGRANSGPHHPAVRASSMDAAAHAATERSVGRRSTR
jgi:hypothetical protein